MSSPNAENPSFQEYTAFCSEVEEFLESKKPVWVVQTEKASAQQFTKYFDSRSEADKSAIEFSFTFESPILNIRDFSEDLRAEFLRDYESSRAQLSKEDRKELAIEWQAPCFPGVPVSGADAPVIANRKLIETFSGFVEAYSENCDCFVAVLAGAFLSPETDTSQLSEYVDALNSYFEKHSDKPVKFVFFDCEMLPEKLLEKETLHVTQYRSDPYQQLRANANLLKSEKPQDLYRYHLVHLGTAKNAKEAALHKEKALQVCDAQGWGVQAGGCLLQAAAVEISLEDSDAALKSYQDAFEKVDPVLTGEGVIASEQKQALHIQVGARFGEASIHLGRSDHQLALQCYSAAFEQLSAIEDKELGFHILTFEAARMGSYCSHEIKKYQDSLAWISTTLDVIESVEVDQQKNFMVDELAKVFCHYRNLGFKPYAELKARFENLLEDYEAIAKEVTPL